MSAADFVPATRSIARLTTAAETCRGCELYENATQTVFGVGPRRARLLLVGEQSGDVGDRDGRPFVGPAGKVLDRALAAVSPEIMVALGATATLALCGPDVRLSGHRGERLRAS